MATIHKRFKINASADKVWEKMSDFSNVHTLFNMLSNAQLNGDVRVCRTADGGEMKELMVSADHLQKRLVYSITESPFDFEFHCASWQAIAEGSHTIFEWYTDLKPDGMASIIEEVIDSERENIIRGLED